MPRFVILNHDHPFPHWDLLLENGDTCRTWRLLADPDTLAARIPAEEIPNHRLHYLDYEGPISGQRGNVTRWDAGTFTWRQNEPQCCEVVVAGHRWQGLVRLQQVDAGAWQCLRG